MARRRCPTTVKAAVATVPLNADLSGFALNDAVKALRADGHRRAARRSARRGHRRARVRRRHRELVLRGQHHAARRHRGGGGAAADRHLPLAGAVAGAAAGDRVRRPGRRRRRTRGRQRTRNDPRRIDVGHHQRAGVRRGHQLRAAADLPIPRRVGPQRRITATPLGIAVRQAGPAILASNATVVLALLTLLFASSPSTRSLGVQAAAGLVVAAVFVLLVLPPLLALFGKRLFWPFIPQVGAKPLTDSGIWHRVADAVARRPGTCRDRGDRRPGAVVHGLADHTDRPVADRAVPGAGRVGQRLRDTGGPLPQRSDRPHPRHRADRPGRRDPTGDHRHPRRRVRRHRRARAPEACRQWSVVLDAEPASDEALQNH